MAEAERVLRDGLKNVPGHHKMLNELGHVLGKTGRPEEARYFLAQAVQLAPQNAAYRVNYVKSRLESGLDAQAAEQYRAHLDLKSDNPAVINALARLLATSPHEQLHDGLEAVRLAEELCRQIGRNNHAALDTLAAVHARAGSFDQAIVVAERAIRFATSAKAHREAAIYGQRLLLYRRQQPYVESR